MCYIAIYSINMPFVGSYNNVTISVVKCELILKHQPEYFGVGGLFVWKSQSFKILFDTPDSSHSSMRLCSIKAYNLISL
jgi:hypothetical protein